MFRASAESIRRSRIGSPVPVHPRNVDPTYIVEVVAERPGHRRRVLIDQSRPPTPADECGDASEVVPGIGGPRRFPGKEFPQRDRIAAVARLGERHRTHAKAADPSGARVPRDVVSRHRRAREDELAGSTPVVNGAPYVIPDRRRDLPFIDESRDRPLEQEPGIETGSTACILIDIEKHLARRGLPGRGRLATGPRPFDHNRADRRETLTEFVVDDPRSIGTGFIHACHRSAVVPRNTTVLVRFLQQMCSCFCNHTVAAIATAESASGVCRTSPAWSLRHDSVEPPHGLRTERPGRDDLSALAESPTVSSLTFVPPPDTSVAMLVKGCLGRDVACQALQDSRNTLRISTAPSTDTML